MQNENINKDDYKPKFLKKTTEKDTWSLFKIMGEFVNGFEKMREIGPCISIFGSARTKLDNKYYSTTVKIAEKFTKKGYGIITGGGPGIMEAANKGAQIALGKSVGLNIALPQEQAPNQYIDTDKSINFNYFFVRKVMFIKYTRALIAMPGGFGTLDELFEALTLIQTEKIRKIPIVLFGIDFWGGLIDWIKEVMLYREANISSEDLDLFLVTDDYEEAVSHIVKFYPDLEHNTNF